NTNAQSQESLLESIAQRTDENGQSNDSLLEAQLQKTDEVNTSIQELTKKLDPKEIGDGATFVVKGLKGDKGDKG
ncbi:hypothetical protein, partial [Escherichia coli]|uniref:hypothetical protein n=1 Tax=Escherichia coli TaxID=562 RepID=UPI003EC8CD5F